MIVKILFYLFLNLHIIYCKFYIRGNNLMDNSLINDINSTTLVKNRLNRKLLQNPPETSTVTPTETPTVSLTVIPTLNPTALPTTSTPTTLTPTISAPTYIPGTSTPEPSRTPSAYPTAQLTAPTLLPSANPTNEPTVPFASSIVFEILIVIPGLTSAGINTDLTFAIQTAAAESMNILQNQCSVTNVYILPDTTKGRVTITTALSLMEYKTMTASHLYNNKKKLFSDSVDDQEFTANLVEAVTLYSAPYNIGSPVLLYEISPYTILIPEGAPTPSPTQDTLDDGDISLLIILAIVGGPLLCLFSVISIKKMMNPEQNDILTRRIPSNTIQSRVGIATNTDNEFQSVSPSVNEYSHHVQGGRSNGAIHGGRPGRPINGGGYNPHANR